MTRLSALPWRDARWLVLAPHPDDETIGAGALIAEASAAGRLAAVAYLTDGTGSHPNGGATLAAARLADARLALRRLTGRGIAPLGLGWRDADPAAAGSVAFVRTRDRLAGLLRRHRVDAIAVTASHEPHCDHAAAFDLARAAAGIACRRVAIFEYRVWGGPMPPIARRYRTAPIAPGIRRSALAAHRSQTGPRFGDGFRLPAAAWRMPATDLLYRRCDARG